MKKLKRIFALLLVVTLVSTTQGTHVLAEENAMQVELEEIDTLLQSEDTEDKTDQEEINQEQTEDLSESESSVDEEDTGTPETAQADSYILPEIGFVYAEFMELDIPGTQNIALVFDEEVCVDSPKVRYRIGDKEKEYTIDLIEQVENILLFTEDYTIASQTGIYRIIGFSYEVSGEYYEVDFKTETSYSVGEKGAITENKSLVDITDVDSLAAVETAASLVGASVIEIEGGLSTSDISRALANAKTIATEEGVTLKSTLSSQIESLSHGDSNLVVVLAPGYCATHNDGAVRGSTSETSLVLAIAQYAKEELETYAGVTVYLSQTTESCTWGTSLPACLSGHADYAASVDADVLISLSISPADTTTATGTEAIITIHSDYYNSLYNLSSNILAQLTKVGLDIKSIYTNADDVELSSYSTDQLINGFSVIRNSVLQGIPAFILEHSLNKSLNQALLSSESELQAIGIADAAGIANYYRLTKKTTESSVRVARAAITATVDQRALISAFVTRLYQNILGRNPSSSEANGWINVLANKKETGAQVVMGFVNSPEFTARGVTNSNYVEILYKTMFNRASDSAGKTSWVNLLNIGMSRYHVASGFTNSNEFDALCKTYGIDRGTLKSTEPRDQNEGYTRFVSRLYTKALNRKCDVSGLNAWTNVLIKGTNTYEQVAENFIFSSEFTQRNLGNTEYVKVLYRTFLDREPSNSEVTAWVNAINNGQTRKSVLYGFSRSTEFRVLTEQIVENTNGIVSVNGRNMHSQYYTDPQVSDRTLLAALISTEAGGESYAGQVAVGVVVLNRMAHSWYPDGLKENIYLENQFQVARITIPAVASPLTTVLQNTSKISQSCWDAADAVLAMKNSKKTVPGIKLPVGKLEFDYLFFMTPAAYENNKKDGDEALTIGSHVFFNRK